MPTEIEIRIAPERASDPAAIAEAAAQKLGVDVVRITSANVVRRSIDARPRPPVVVLRVRVWIDEAETPDTLLQVDLPDVRDAAPVVIVGAGPAGLFAALRLIEGGLRPIVLERGRDVRGRRRDVALLNRNGVVDPDSNYCFGEGGAGTFSDGKLYTRSTKRGEVRRVLETLVRHGAPPDTLIDAHPHIGTNRLPAVVQALRETILAQGGIVRFDTRVTDLQIKDSRVTGVITAAGDVIEGGAVILATGHSARDIYQLLHRRGLHLEQKAFALGVRVEHSQSLIDRIQYHCEARPTGLPAASYSLVTRLGDRSVYSFCMCPGGIICPTATALDEVVVNGWSPSRRNSRWANSGIVAEVTLEDLRADYGDDVLAGIAYQTKVEHAAALAGGGACVAPAQRLSDFVDGHSSSESLPVCSYTPGVRATDLGAVFPKSISTALRAALRNFGNMMRGYLNNDAIVVGVESRTSAPVRIPRDKLSCEHPEAPGLYPCGEGAGAAGGIVPPLWMANAAPQPFCAPELNNAGGASGKQSRLRF